MEISWIEKALPSEAFLQSSTSSTGPALELPVSASANQALRERPHWLAVQRAALRLWGGKLTHHSFPKVPKCPTPVRVAVGGVRWWEGADSRAQAAAVWLCLCPKSLGYPGQAGMGCTARAREGVGAKTRAPKRLRGPGPGLLHSGVLRSACSSPILALVSPFF